MSQWHKSRCGNRLSLILMRITLSISSVVTVTWQISSANLATTETESNVQRIPATTNHLGKYQADGTEWKAQQIAFEDEQLQAIVAFRPDPCIGKKTSEQKQQENRKSEADEGKSQECSESCPTFGLCEYVKSEKEKPCGFMEYLRWKMAKSSAAQCVCTRAADEENAAITDGGSMEAIWKEWLEENAPSPLGHGDPCERKQCDDECSKGCPFGTSGECRNTGGKRQCYCYVGDKGSTCSVQMNTWLPLATALVKWKSHEDHDRLPDDEEPCNLSNDPSSREINCNRRCMNLDGEFGQCRDEEAEYKGALNYCYCSINEPSCTKLAVVVSLGQTLKHFKLFKNSPRAAVAAELRAILQVRKTVCDTHRPEEGDAQCSDACPDTGSCLMDCEHGSKQCRCSPSPRGLYEPDEDSVDLEEAWRQWLSEYDSVEGHDSNVCNHHDHGHSENDKHALDSMNLECTYRCPPIYAGQCVVSDELNAEGQSVSNCFCHAKTEEAVKKPFTWLPSVSARNQWAYISTEEEQFYEGIERGTRPDRMCKPPFKLFGPIVTQDKRDLECKKKCPSVAQQGRCLTAEGNSYGIKQHYCFCLMHRDLGKLVNGLQYVGWIPLKTAQAYKKAYYSHNE